MIQKKVFGRKHTFFFLQFFFLLHQSATAIKTQLNVMNENTDHLPECNILLGNIRSKLSCGYKLLKTTCPNTIQDHVNPQPPFPSMLLICPTDIGPWARQYVPSHHNKCSNRLPEESDKTLMFQHDLKIPWLGRCYGSRSHAFPCHHMRPVWKKWLHLQQTSSPLTLEDSLRITLRNAWLKMKLAMVPPSVLLQETSTTITQ